MAEEVRLVLASGAPSRREILNRILRPERIDHRQLNRRSARSTSVFEELDLAAMLALSATPYQYAQWKKEVNGTH
jgi:predicted house-cleaning NTP pyrophosphatase (Maf/HAM1 superfamily)